MKHPSRKRALRKVGLSSAIAATVFASGIGVASASTHASTSVSPPAARGSKDARTTPPTPMSPRGPQGSGGEVTALSAASITVTTSSGPVTYSINADTTISDHRPGATSATLALGEDVLITPTTTDSNVAASITIVPASIGGRVSAIDGDTITVTGPNATSATILVNVDTTYFKSGASATLSDVSVGSFVVATGTFGSTPSSLDATTVGIGTPGPGISPMHGDGPGPLAGPFAGGLPDLPPPGNANARGALRQ